MIGIHGRPEKASRSRRDKLDRFGREVVHRKDSGADDKSARDSPQANVGRLSKPRNQITEMHLLVGDK